MNLAKYKPGECEIGTDMKLYKATASADLHNIIQYTRSLLLMRFKKYWHQKEECISMQESIVHAVLQSLY